MRRAASFLSALALAAPVGLLVASVSSAAGTLTIAVSAATPMRPSGVTLARNQHATISATGLISYGSQNASCAGSSITPNGCAAETICPVAGGCGALIGQVGTGKAFIVGRGRTVDGPGALSLGINDQAGAYGDNSGAFHVTIDVGPGAEVAKVLRIYSGHLYVRRGARVSALSVGEQINLGDELLTSQNGGAALEFVIGGRVRIGAGATVTVTGERSINGGGEEDTTLKFVTKGLPPSRVEIQTNGGVLGGIKG